MLQSMGHKELDTTEQQFPSGGRISLGYHVWDTEAGISVLRATPLSPLPSEEASGVLCSLGRASIPFVWDCLDCKQSDWSEARPEGVQKDDRDKIVRLSPPSGTADLSLKVRAAVDSDNNSHLLLVCIVGTQIV